jgi:hypothetical protein
LTQQRFATVLCDAQMSSRQPVLVDVENEVVDSLAQKQTKQKQTGYVNLP